MNVLDPWRQELRALIPRGFLRRDQGDSLFISDYPRFPGAEQAAAALRQAGYQIAQNGGVARINGTPEKYFALFRALPHPDPAPTDETLYAVSLANWLADAATPPEDEPLDLYPALLKALDAGRWQEAAQHAAAWRAVCQRQGRKPPTAAGKLILLALAARKGEETAC